MSVDVSCDSFFTFLARSLTAVMSRAWKGMISNTVTERRMSGHLVVLEPAGAMVLLLRVGKVAKFSTKLLVEWADSDRLPKAAKLSLQVPPLHFWLQREYIHCNGDIGA